MFEDAEKAPISQMLASAYKNQSDVMLYFTGGNSVLRDKLCEIYNAENQYIIYIDLVPDNYTTIREYRMLRKIIRRRNFKNVYILPIICMEYYIMKTFFLKMPAIETAINCEDYREYGTQSSLERYCKFVLNTVYPVCMHTDSDYSPDVKFGWFYVQDCLCVIPLKECHRFSLLDKAGKLVKGLPAFYKPGDWADCGVKKVDLEIVHNKLVEEFKRVVNRYSVLGLIDSAVQDYKIE